MPGFSKISALACLCLGCFWFLGSCLTPSQDLAEVHDASNTLADTKTKCQEVTSADIDALSSSNTKLLFFSSWCMGCSKKLTAEYPGEKVIAVGTMDDHDSVERVFRHSGSNLACLYDKNEQLVSKYGVKSLPAYRWSKPDKNR